MEAMTPMHWTRAGLRNLVLCGAALVLVATARGQAGLSAAVPLQTTVSGALQSLASRAATIFSGQVVSIDRRAGVVEITFRVEQPVAGAVGPSYVLREWAGLWPPGQLRYHVGERALLFVHAPSSAGFASPVNGQEGVVPVLVEGANAPALLDVRRLAAGLQRTPGTPLAPEGEGAVQLADAIALITATKQAGATRGVPLPPLPHVPMPEHVFRFTPSGSPVLSSRAESSAGPGVAGGGLPQGRPLPLRVSEVPYAAR